MKKLLLLITLLYSQLTVAQVGNGYKMTGKVKEGERGGASYSPNVNKKVTGALPLIAKAVTPPAIGGNLFIWQTSAESTKPGRYVALMGNFPSDAKAYLIAGEGTEAIPLDSVAAQEENFIQPQIPAKQPFGIYQVYVAANGYRSATVWFNRTMPYGTDSPEIFSGGTLRINGRDLMVKDTIPSVRFVSQTTGVSLDATVLTGESHRWKLVVQAPFGLVTGQVYDLYVNNNLDGAIGEQKVGNSVTAYAPVFDFFDLKMGWSHWFTPSIYNNVYNVKTDSRLGTKAKGDTVTNDYAAINAALTAAKNAGGGIVYLPKGRYKYQGTGRIELGNKVVLMGEGELLTAIDYEGMNTPFIYVASGIKTAGVINITLNHTSATGTTRGCDIRGENVFLKNVGWHLNNNGNIPYFKDCKKLLIQGCNMDQTDDPASGLLSLEDDSFVSIRKNTLRFSVTALKLFTSTNCFVEGNKMIRDLSIPIKTTTIVHVIATASCPNTLFEDIDEIRVNGERARETPPAGKVDPNGFPDIVAENDGEGALTENKLAWITSGMVSSATANTFTDVGHSWRSIDAGARVFISKGKGMGQDFGFASKTGDVITIDKPWDVVPDTSSRYVLYNLDVEKMIFFNVRMKDQQRGFTFYGSNIKRVDLDGCVLDNSGSIDFMGTLMDYWPKDDPAPDPNQPRQSVMMKINVENCTVKSPNDKYNGASFNAGITQDLMYDYRGMLMFAPSFSDCTLENKIPNFFSVVDTDWEPTFNFKTHFNRYTKQTGVNNYYRSDATGKVKQIWSPMVQNCRTINCNYGVTVTANTANVLIKGMKMQHQSTASGLIQTLYYRTSSSAFSTTGAWKTVVKP